MATPTEPVNEPWRDALRLIERKLNEWEERDRPARVLLVDDDANDIAIVSRQLEKFHCSLTVCLNSTEAADLISKGKFDFVFLDLLMPKTSGTEVLKSLLPNTSSTRFVLVTGYPSSPMVDETLKLGAVLAPKPLTDQMIRTFLRPK